MRIGDRHQAYGNAWLTTRQTASLVDVSGDGLRVRAGARLEPGMVTHVQLDLPDGTGRLRCRCRVIWCKACDADCTEYVAGLEFVDLSAGDRQRLARARGRSAAPPGPDEDASLA